MDPTTPTNEKASIAGRFRASSRMPSTAVSLAGGLKPRRSMKGIVLMGCVFGLWTYGVHHSTKSFSIVPPGAGTITLASVEELLHNRLGHLKSSIDTDYVTNKLGINMKETGLAEYKADLYKIYLDYFDRPETDKHGKMWETVEGFLELVPDERRKAKGRRKGSEGIPLGEGIPKLVYATSKNPDLPHYFYSWANLNLDWTVAWFDDSSISANLFENFGPYEQQNLGRRVEALKGTEEEDKPLLGFIKEYDALPKGVLKSDMFRYLRLLMDGGIYTDSDTSCVRPLNEWPGLHGHDPRIATLSDPLFTTLPYLAGLEIQANTTQTPAPDSKIHAELERKVLASSMDRGLGSPSLIVAVEFDSIAEKVDRSKGGHARNIQIAQWTMGANKYHPVFLDAMGRIMKYSEDYRLNQGDMGIYSTYMHKILDWTGPGVFTDCVFRYLFARYGVRPEQISGLNHAVRIGDVLVLPRNAFRAARNSGFQGEYSLVHHATMQRWHYGKAGAI